MTEVEQLIKQAKGVKKRWKKPLGGTESVSTLSWQELLDGKPYPCLRLNKL